MQVKYCLDLGISADSASRFFISFGLSSSVARVAAGRICDVTWVNTIYIYQFGALLDGFVIVVLPVIRSYTGILFFSVIYGICDGIFISTMNSLLMFNVEEDRRAAALGLGNSLIAFAIASGSPFAGEQSRFTEGLNGVNREPSKIDNFNRQTSIKPGIISRQRSQCLLSRTIMASNNDVKSTISLYIPK